MEGRGKVTKSTPSKLEAGLTYSITDVEVATLRKKAYREFTKHVYDGAKGLVLTKMPVFKARKIAEDVYHDEPEIAKVVGDIEFLYLRTGQPRSEGELCDSSSAKISTTINNHFEKNKGNGIAMIDAVEHLCSINGYKSIYNQISQFSDRAYDSECVLLIPLIPKAFREEEYHNLVRNMITLSGS